MGYARLSDGTVLPEPGVVIFKRRWTAEAGAALTFRKERPPSTIAFRAQNTRKWAWSNAVALLDEAQLLASAGRHARAFVLAATSLEEIGKSQYSADVETGFVPHEGFDRNIRDHEFKSAYQARAVELGSAIEPILLDDSMASSLFRRRNDALYASPSGEVNNGLFETDAAAMIDYCYSWLETIMRQEEIAERIGTRAFLR